MENGPKFCYHCGTNIEVGEKFCHKCGVNLQSQDESPNSISSKKKTEGGFIENIREKYDIKKVIILMFIGLSVLMNCVFMPWIRIFPDSNKIGMGHRNQTQIEYSTIFYKPLKFHDGWSSQSPGETDNRGVYLGYDYKTIAIHELMLAGVFLVGYLVMTIKKRE
jgi:hypothetical protein